MIINLKTPATPPLFCFGILNKHKSFVQKSLAKLYKYVGSFFKVALLPFLFIALALPLLVGCGLAEQNGSVIQSSEVNALNKQIAEKKTELSSLRSSSGSRSYSRSRRDVRRSAELEQEIADLTVAQQPVIVQSLVATGINVEDYIPTVVLLYSIIGKCNSASDESTHKTCVNNCYNNLSGSLLNQCVKNTCDTANSNACKTTASICSGVFQQADHILTNHHCVEADIAGYINPDDNKYYYSIRTAVENKSKQKTMLKTVKWYDETADVALVELNSSLSDAELPDFTGRVSELSLLDVLFTIGQPTPGLTPIKWTASAGYLTNKGDPGLCSGRCISYSIPVGGGNSGGPVFNNAGKLVALIAKIKIGYDNLRFGPHIDRINHLIRQAGTGPVRSLSSFQNLQAEGFFELSSSAQEEKLEAIKELAIELADD